MNGELPRLIIALVVIISFTALMAAVLFGFVAIESPEVAKLVGSIFGWMTGLVTPIVMRYFRDDA